MDRFNLELNASPTLLAGNPFTALGGELTQLLGRVADAAGGRGGRPALVGVLPTLRRTDLHPGVITDGPRYRALNAGLRQLRHDSFQIRIAGDDPLELASGAVEGANTSFQLHLRVNPADFTRTYNAVQFRIGCQVPGSPGPGLATEIAEFALPAVQSPPQLGGAVIGITIARNVTSNSKNAIVGTAARASAAVSWLTP